MKLYKTLTLFLFSFSVLFAQKDIPHLKQKGSATQLIVNDKPFLMIAGEMHNSSASTKEFMKPIFPKLKKMNLNAVFVTVAWEQLEPEEGHFDFSLVDAIIDNARENDLKVCLLWFGSWKNGQSSYAPLWVKKDTRRFVRVKTKEGKEIETLSPFCEATKKADAKAFSQLLSHVKAYDKNQTVILVQPENEVGMFQDIDYNNASLKKFEEQVPDELMRYLKKNKDHLEPFLAEAWAKNNYKISGSWKTVFGDTPHTKVFFATWQYATYINFVAKSGRMEYNLPMMVNAWLSSPESEIGKYPNGGPGSWVMDIWKAGAPAIDILSPDIYSPKFKEICAQYHRDDNPLLIPESKGEVGRAFYAYGQHDAICFSPFGIEDLSDDLVFKKSYQLLNELEDLILKYQGTNHIRGILKQGEETGTELVMGDYKLKVNFPNPKAPGFGIVIQTDDDQFIIAGMNLKIFVESTKKSKTGYIAQVWEGGFENGNWIPTRLMNGDETRHNEHVFIFGRSYDTSGGKTKEPVLEGRSGGFSPAGNNNVVTPGIYKLLVYER